MRAWIDNQNRAMVEMSIASHARSKREKVEAWIDTAFDGHLVMPKSEIVRLGLGVLADTDAVLAGGSTTRLRCYYCVVDWLGEMTPIQVVENAGSLPLVGTALLCMADIRINFRSGNCSVS